MSLVNSFELTTVKGALVEAVGLIFEHERDLYLVVSDADTPMPLACFTCNTNFISFLHEYYY